MNRLPFKHLLRLKHRVACLAAVFANHSEIVGFCAPVTMTMTMSHSEKSIPLSLEAWPYRLQCRGHSPPEKSLLEQVWLALLATVKMTVCSTSNLDEKCEWLKKEKHLCSCTEFSGFNSMSIESSDSEQYNEGSLEPGNRRSQNKQPGHQRKKLAGTLAHQSVLSSFHLLCATDMSPNSLEPHISPCP